MSHWIWLYELAQAWLANSSPLTFVRLLGRAHTDADDGGEAGWKIGGGAVSDEGGAFGLFLVDSGSTNHTGSLAAVFYTRAGYSMAHSGSPADGTAHNSPSL